MRCVIVTGMSGAGKSTALKMLEDVGYFCVDNLPVPLIPKMADLLRVPGSELNAGSRYTQRGEPCRDGEGDGRAGCGGNEV